MSWRAWEYACTSPYNGQRSEGLGTKSLWSWWHFLTPVTTYNFWTKLSHNFEKFRLHGRIWPIWIGPWIQLGLYLEDTGTCFKENNLHCTVLAITCNVRSRSLEAGQASKSARQNIHRPTCIYPATFLNDHFLLYTFLHAIYKGAISI